MTNTNKELLDWAVENIGEWDDIYSHLRSDSISCRYTEGLNWVINGDKRWVVVDYNGRFKIYSKFSTPTPQVITKEEWLAAKEKAVSGSTKLSPKDMLVAGKHLVECSDGSRYLFLDGGILFNITQYGWVNLKHYDSNLLASNTYMRNINKIYTFSIIGDYFNMKEERNLTLVWERNVGEKTKLRKEIEELKSQLKEKEEQLNSL